MVNCSRVQFMSGDNLLSFSTAPIIIFQLDFDRLRSINLPELLWSSNLYNTPVHSVPCLCFHHKCLSFFRLEMELLTSPQLDTSQCSHTSSCKEWLFSFTLSIISDLELLVLIFSIYITSVSLPYKAFRDTQKFAKSLSTLSRCGVGESSEMFRRQLDTDTALINLL